jgi:hypothetical protein
MLKTHYPEHDWPVEDFMQTYSKGHQHLMYRLRQIFPDSWEIKSGKSLPFEVFDQQKKFEVKNFPQKMYYPSGRAMLWDVWIPRINLIIEYQGHQHYDDAALMGEYHLEEQNER